MADELEKLLDEGEGKAKAPALDDKKSEPTADEVTKKKEEQLANINKAILEGNDELRRIRKAKKESTGQPVEEELPKIDLNDPGSKAWDKHFSEKVTPIQSEMDKEKEEVRTFALQRFLADKPDLAKDPEKLKRVMGTYEKIRTASERTQEGVLLDLGKSYAAEFHTEILNRARGERLEEAQGDAIFSDAGVSRGASSSPTERERAPHISKDDEMILAKWGLTPAEWVKMKQSQDKKK